MTDPDPYASSGSAADPDLGALARSVPGPDTWWDGPLDVETLAVGSVAGAAAAANRLAAARGLEWQATVDRSAVAHAFASLTHLRVDGRQPEAFAPLSRMFEVADGWVRLHANYDHHRAAALAALGAADPGQVAAVLAGWPALEVEEAVVAAGGVAAALRTPEEWAAHPQGRAVSGLRLVQVAQREDRRELWPGDGAPMSGLRVLDLTRVVAGPVCTRVFALLGADVLRVDPAHRPELLDHHLDAGGGKRSAVADLADPAVAERIHGLLEEADVLVAGYRPGSLERFGLEAGQVAEGHPHLVIGRLSAWGHEGPWRHRRGFDSVVQVATGIAHRYGTRVGESWRPGVLPVQALDHATGYLLAAAVLDQLAAATTATLTVSLARTAAWLLATGPRPPSEPAAPADGAADEPDGHDAPGLAPPVLQRRSSTMGMLTSVAPALVVDGRPVDDAWAPTRYGASALTWRSRRRWAGCGGRG